MSFFSDLIPVPTPLKSRSLVQDLKTRLDWGEPALTIVDVRDLNAFNISHIQGAISMPMDTLVDQMLKTLELERDIYVYGEIDEETTEAATQLRAAGFLNVSELIGGVAAWKAVGYPLESITAIVA